MATGFSLATLGHVGGAVGALAGLTGMAQQARAARVQQSAGAAQLAADRQSFEAQQRRRSEALRRTIAQARARIGAGGTGGGGSASALLAGLASEAEREAREDRDLFERGDAIGRRNLLARRLQQPTGLERLHTGLDAVHRFGTSVRPLIG